MSLLADPYYSEAHQVFRQATTQTEMMVQRLVDHLDGCGPLSVCSVGSGSGLFELPLLTRLSGEEIPVRRFVGVDPSEHASASLEQKLQEVDGLDFEVVVRRFRDYHPQERFDLVLFNHVLEYLRDDVPESLARSRAMVDPDGAVFVFSPMRGGINAPYESIYRALTGSAPIFADEIAAVLDAQGIEHIDETLVAACDTAALDRGHSDEAGVKLLSFLTHRDLREVEERVWREHADYFRSLRPPGSTEIPHPVALLVI